MKKLILTVVMLGGFAASAHAMDDAERARQMQLYASQNNGGAMVTTTTNVPTPMPHVLPAGATTITASKTTASRSEPVAPMVMTTESTAPANTTSIMATTRSMPIVETETTQTTTVSAPVTTTETKATAQMSPLNDNGTPMNEAPIAGTLGTTTQTTSQTPTVTTTTTMSAHDREMQAYEAWKASQPQAAIVVPNAVAPVAYGNAPQSIMTTGPVTTTTTEEQTTTTNYVVSKQKVGLVGNRPYPAVTSELPGGVTKQVTVNGVANAPEILVPDAVAPMKDEQPTGDYYASRRGAEVYKGTIGSVRVHETGKFN